MPDLARHTGLAIALAALAACVAPGSGSTPAPPLVGDLACIGAAPLCITSCNSPDAISESHCEDGLWHCVNGIRDDLCCDPFDAPERCPEWGDLCDESSPCTDGYTCVTGRSWPLPADSGVCRLGDWRIPSALATCDPSDALSPSLLSHVGPAVIKLDGIVTTVMNCDDRRCDIRNPCCQRCLGNYVLEMPNPEGPPSTIALRTETLSCVGTNCGFSCAPMQPGRRYRVWGIFLPDDGAQAPGTLFVAGTCAD
jgi:hypothetical protein